MLSRPRRAVFIGLSVVFVLLCLLTYAAIDSPASVWAGPVGQGSDQGTVPGTVPGTIPATATPTATRSPTRQPAATPTTSTRPTRAPLRPRKPTPTASTGAPAAADPQPDIVRVGPAALVALMGDPQSETLYALTEADVLVRSQDAGATWSLVSAEPELADFLVSPADGATLYSGTRGDCGESEPPSPFFTSADGGRRWSTIPLATGLLPLLGHPTDADMVLAADCELPFLSGDGGRNWAAKPDQSRAHLWESYVMTHAAAATQVNAATADDAHWHYLFAAGTIPAGRDLPALEGNSVVAYSGDMGESWERITPRMNPAPRNLSALLVDRLVAGRLWFADAQGVWTTDDFGATWEILHSGLGALVEKQAADEDNGELPALRALALAQNDSLYLGTTQGLYRLEPDSTRWTAVTDGFFGRAPVIGLLILDADPDTLWVTTESGVYRYPLGASR